MQLIQEAGMNFIYDDNGTLVMKSKVKTEHRSMSESKIIESLTGQEPVKDAEPKPRKKRASKVKTDEQLEASAVDESGTAE